MAHRGLKRRGEWLKAQGIIEGEEGGKEKGGEKGGDGVEKRKERDEKKRKGSSWGGKAMGNRFLTADASSAATSPVPVSMLFLTAR